MEVSVLAWVAYILGYPLAVYDNRFTFCGFDGRPLWYSPLNQGILNFGRRILTYGGLFGIGYTEGWIVAVVAFATYFGFMRITLRHFFNRELQVQYTDNVEYLRRNAAAKDEAIDDIAISQEAFELAQFTMTKRMRGEL